MRKASYKFGFVNVLIFTLITCTYLVLINSFSQYSKLHVLQQIIAKTIYSIQSALGINVVLQDTILYYPKLFSLNMTLLCTGINEILFFSLILLGFIGVSLKTKLKGYAIFFPIILAENIARVTIIQPLAILLGKTTALSFHNFSFKYGQMIFIIILVIIWFHCFAKKEFRKSVRNYRLTKHSRPKRLRRKKKS